MLDRVITLTFRFTLRMLSSRVVSRLALSSVKSEVYLHAFITLGILLHAWPRLDPRLIRDA
jgi:hypothetical protein